MWKRWIRIFSILLFLFPHGRRAVCGCHSFSALSGFDLPQKWKLLHFFLPLNQRWSKMLSESLRRIFYDISHVMSHEHWPILCFLISLTLVLVHVRKVHVPTPWWSTPHHIKPRPNTATRNFTFPCENKMNYQWSLRWRLSFAGGGIDVVLARQQSVKKLLIECVHTLAIHVTLTGCTLFRHNDQCCRNLYGACRL